MRGYAALIIAIMILAAVVAVVLVGTMGRTEERVRTTAELNSVPENIHVIEQIGGSTAEKSVTETETGTQSDEEKVSDSETGGVKNAEGEAAGGTTVHSGGGGGGGSNRSTGEDVDQYLTDLEEMARELKEIARVRASGERDVEECIEARLRRLYEDSDGDGRWEMDVTDTVNSVYPGNARAELEGSYQILEYRKIEGHIGMDRKERVSSWERGVERIEIRVDKTTCPGIRPEAQGDYIVELPCELRTYVRKVAVYILTPGQEEIELNFDAGDPWISVPIDRDGDGRGDFVMRIQPHNVVSARGIQKMRYDRGRDAVIFESNAWDVELKQSKWFMIHGYPHLKIGWNPYHGFYHNGTAIELPSRIADLPDFTLTLKYDVETENNLPINLLVDNWLLPEKNRTSGIKPVDTEFLLILYRDHLEAAPGELVDEINLPIVINGECTTGHFEVWVKKRNEKHHQMIEFRLNPPVQGEIKLNYREYLKAANRYSDVNLETFYLPGVWVGTEYGTAQTERTVFHWEISGFDLIPGVPEECAGGRK